MSGAASLGVLLPTRNAAALLPRHLETMNTWLDLVQEIVVVDSHSTDGTIDLLRRRLQHPRLRLESHPPGLYQSWNFGIQQLETEYVYIATAGDTISRAGIQHLHAAAVELQCDVVMSKPAFRDLAGNPLAVDWPIDDVIRTLGLTSPKRLHPLQALLFILAHVENAFTGSCASNLFRTAILKRFPFPTEFGTAGDGAWSVLHAGEVTWAVLPAVFSEFVRHPSGASAEETHRWQTAPRMDRVARAMVHRLVSQGNMPRETLDSIGVFALLDTLSRFMDRKAQYDALRRARWPWILRPAAWRTRRQRNRFHAELRTVLLTGLKRIAQEPSAPNP